MADGGFTRCTYRHSQNVLLQVHGMVRECLALSTQTGTKGPAPHPHPASNMVCLSCSMSGDVTSFALA